MKNNKKILSILIIVIGILGVFIKPKSNEKVQINKLNDKKILVSGDAIGVKLKIDGVMVLGISDVLNEDGIKVYPLRKSGIRIGDIIVELNDTKITNVRDFLFYVRNTKGKEFKVLVKRKGKYFNTKLRAVKSYEDSKYHLGIWVRDSIKGIGTLTYYDPQTGYFGALGHGISDTDTKEIFNSKGEILKASILSIKHGKIGVPGELRGIFVLGEGKLGDILKNTNQGIYGILKKEKLKNIYGKMYEIAQKEDVMCGKASILTNVIGNKNAKYDIEILRISKNGMNIRVTDKRLLKSTGGIVQGMSGCPILQNGKIIGAITHVFVNNPTKGDGIFIENMLRNSE